MDSSRTFVKQNSLTIGRRRAYLWGMKWIFLLAICLSFGCASADPASAQKKEAEILRSKYAKYSNEELKLMHSRYAGLAKESSGRDTNITFNPLARRIWGDSDTQNTERLLEIEREMMRRGLTIP